MRAASRGMRSKSLQMVEAQTLQQVGGIQISQPVKQFNNLVLRSNTIIDGKYGSTIKKIWSSRFTYPGFAHTEIFVAEAQG